MYTAKLQQFALIYWLLDSLRGTISIANRCGFQWKLVKSPLWEDSEISLFYAAQCLISQRICIKPIEIFIGTFDATIQFRLLFFSSHPSPFSIEHLANDDQVIRFSYSVIPLVLLIVPSALEPDQIILVIMIIYVIPWQVCFSNKSTRPSSDKSKYPTEVKEHSARANESS